jgi:glutaconate CoA-transferase, subunit B
MHPSYSRLEMMVVAASRLLHNRERVLVGTGIPLVAAILAKKTHARDMVMVMEAVAFDSNPEALPFCVADPRAVYRTTWTPTSAEVMGHFLQSGKIDVGFLGGAQVDRYGNLNSTCIGPYDRPRKRFEGSGGAGDIASLAKRTIIIMNHEKRRFVENVDYITSPGWKCRSLDWASDVMREEIGLDGGPHAVVSTLGVMKFDPHSRAMYVDTYYEDLGVLIGDIRAATEFDIDGSRARPMEQPTKDELTVLREQVDPEGIFMKY